MFTRLSLVIGLVGLLVGMPSFRVAMAELQPSGGYVYALKGHAVIMRQGSPVEKSLAVGDEIRSGDLIETGKGSAVSIRFDQNFNNAVQVPAESRAVFQSLKPLVIDLKSGSVFNVVDGLPQGSTWKVTTPVAVAAVRGTVFLVRYGISGGEYYAATIDVPDDGRNSAIEISSLTGEDGVRVAEGYAIEFAGEENFRGAVLRDLDPEAVQDARDFLAEVLAERSSLGESLPEDMPEPIAEYSETICDASGQNCNTQTCRMTEAGKVCSYV